MSYSDDKDFKDKKSARKGNYKKKRPYKKTKGMNSSNWSDFKDKYNEKDSAGANDPSWYSKYPELMQTVASIPYSIPAGTEIEWDLNIDPAKVLQVTGASGFTFQSVPGILALSILPVPGLSKDGVSPLNVGARLLFTNVRQENSGHANYDWPDLMLYVLAMDQVYSFVTWMNRVYGCFMLAANQSRYMPKALLEAQKIDFEDLLKHGNDFKAFIDMITAQAAQMAVPNDVTLFNRHAFMYQDVYIDADSVKAQMYMYVPAGFYYYDEYNGPGKLVPYVLNDQFTSTHLLTFDELKQIWHVLFDPIINSEDFAIMSGDILKAFKTDTVKLSLMPVGYTIMPKLDYEVLTQMKNATINQAYLLAATGATAATWEITQDVNTNNLIFDPVVANSSTPIHYNVDTLWLSTYKKEPQPADNMVYTRLMNTTKTIEDTSQTPTAYVTRFTSLGSELVVGVYAFGWRRLATGWDLGTEIISSYSMVGTNISATLGFMRKMAMAKHFDFCPALYIFVETSNDVYFYPCFDLDNWTMVGSRTLDKMHNAALLSMLRVPMIGSALPVPRTGK